MGDAAMGSSQASEALGKLGLSAQSLMGLSPDKQLEAIADRIAGIESPTLRTAAAMDIFGKSGTQLLPMFADGAAGIRAMRDQADALGITISTEAAASAAKLNDALGTMWSAVKALTLNIGAALAPTLSEAADRIAWSGIKVAFYRGVAELASVWSVVQTGAMRAFTAIQAAVSQVMTTIGQAVVTAFNAVTGFLGRTFSGYVQSGFAVASGLASAFGSFKTSTIESLSATAKAMMHGDFAVAGEVAWTSIELAFVQGIAWVTNAWTEFTTGLATIFDGVVVAIRTAWNNLTVFIGQLLMYQVARFQMLLDRLAQFDPTGLAAKLRSALDVNVGGTITAMEEDRERFNRGLAEARERRDSERAAHMQARLAETEARLAELRRQREDALARARTAVETSEKDSGGSPLAGAMDDLRKALAEAAAAPKLFDAGAASDTLGPVGAGLDDMMTSSGGKGLSSQGTFSAAAVWGLAAGGVNERAAKAAEATAQNTRQLVDHARRGRIVFG